MCSVADTFVFTFFTTRSLSIAHNFFVHAFPLAYYRLSLSLSSLIYYHYNIYLYILGSLILYNRLNCAVLTP